MLKAGFQWYLDGKEASFRVPIIQGFFFKVIQKKKKHRHNLTSQWSDESNKDPEQ